MDLTPFAHLPFCDHCFQARQCLECECGGTGLRDRSDCEVVDRGDAAGAFAVYGVDAFAVDGGDGGGENRGCCGPVVRVDPCSTKTNREENLPTRRDVEGEEYEKRSASAQHGRFKDGGRGRVGASGAGWKKTPPSMSSGKWYGGLRAIVREFWGGGCDGLVGTCRPSTGS